MKRVYFTNELNIENTLLLELAEGDYKAFEKLYKLYWDFVFNDCYRRLKSIEDAENITQDVFLTIWENRKTITSINFKGYLFTLTKNKTLNFIMKNKPMLVAEYEESLVTDMCPYKEILLKEATAKFMNKVISLPNQQRTVFEMRYKENLSTKEIAEIMGLSIKTVRNHLGKALAVVKSILKFLLIILDF